MNLMLTRPRVDSEPLARTLEARGHTCMIEPLLEITFRPVPHGALDGVTGLLFTSANGVRALASSGAPIDLSLPAYCVGDATARTAADVGFQDCRVAGGDVDLLAARVLADPDSGPLLHVAGTKQAGDLGGTLAKAGRTYRRMVLYDAVAAASFSAETQGMLETGKVDGVLLFSPRTAKIFKALVTAGNLGATLKTVSAFCLSQNVADALADVPLGDRSIAAEPTLEALLKLVG